MTEVKKRGRKPKAPEVLEAAFEVVDIPEVKQAQGRVFVNARKGVVDLRGVIFQAGETKVLTEQEQAQAGVKRAIQLGLLKAQ